jgi:hypothetical protein
VSAGFATLIARPPVIILARTLHLIGKFSVYPKRSIYVGLNRDIRSPPKKNYLNSPAGHPTNSAVKPEL